MSLPSSADSLFQAIKRAEGEEERRFEFSLRQGRYGLIALRSGMGNNGGSQIEDIQAGLTFGYRRHGSFAIDEIDGVKEH